MPEEIEKIDAAQNLRDAALKVWNAWKTRQCTDEECCIAVLEMALAEYEEQRDQVAYDAAKADAACVLLLADVALVAADLKSQAISSFGNWSSWLENKSAQLRAAIDRYRRYRAAKGGA